MFKHRLKIYLKTFFWKEVSPISVNLFPESSFTFLHLIIHKPHDLVSAINGLIPQWLKHDGHKGGTSPTGAATSTWPRGSQRGRSCRWKTLKIWKWNGLFVFQFDLLSSMGLEQVFGRWVCCLVIIYVVISLSNWICWIRDRNSRFEI